MMSNRDATFRNNGWLKFPAEPGLKRWATAANELADRSLADPAMAQWYRYQRTWFVGVNALPNDAAGTLPGGTPLAGAAIEAIEAHYGHWRLPLDSGQISVCFPGYPQPGGEESEAVFRYRIARDAAHVDGLHGEGPNRRRFLREPHAFLLGIPLTEVSHDQSPLVIWEGSHRVMAEAFAQVLAPHRPEDWAGVDMTDAYVDARREVFETCPRLEIEAAPGEAYLIHRHALHGVAPWRGGMADPSAGRRIVYFRPQFPNVADWLSAP